MESAGIVLMGRLLLTLCLAAAVLTADGFGGFGTAATPCQLSHRAPRPPLASRPSRDARRRPVVRAEADGGGAEAADGGGRSTPDQLVAAGDASLAGAMSSLSDGP